MPGRPACCGRVKRTAKAAPSAPGLATPGLETMRHASPSANPLRPAPTVGAACPARHTGCAVPAQTETASSPAPTHTTSTHPVPAPHPPGSRSTANHGGGGTPPHRPRPPPRHRRTDAAIPGFGRCSKARVRLTAPAPLWLRRGPPLIGWRWCLSQQQDCDYAKSLALRLHTRPSAAHSVDTLCPLHPRRLHWVGPLLGQGRVLALWAGEEVIPRPQGIAARSDGFRPSAGWAYVGGGAGADGHDEITLLLLRYDSKSPFWQLHSSHQHASFQLTSLLQN